MQRKLRRIDRRIVICCLRHSEVYGCEMDRMCDFKTVLKHGTVGLWTMASRKTAMAYSNWPCLFMSSRLERDALGRYSYFRDATLKKETTRRDCFAIVIKCTFLVALVECVCYSIRRLFLSYSRFILGSCLPFAGYAMAIVQHHSATLVAGGCRVFCYPFGGISEFTISNGWREHVLF